MATLGARLRACIGHHRLDGAYITVGFVLLTLGWVLLIIQGFQYSNPHGKNESASTTAMSTSLETLTIIGSTSLTGFGATATKIACQIDSETGHSHGNGGDKTSTSFNAFASRLLSPIAPVTAIDAGTNFTFDKTVSIAMNTMTTVAIATTNSISGALSTTVRTGMMAPNMLSPYTGILAAETSLIVEAHRTEYATASVFASTATTIFSTPTSPVPFLSPGEPLTAHTTIWFGTSTTEIDDSSTVLTDGVVQSTAVLTTATASSESQYLNEEVASTNNDPWPTSQSFPSSSLTDIDPGFYTAPTQGVPSSVLSSVLTSITSTDTVATTASIAVTDFTPTPTNAQSTPAPTAAPTPNPSVATGGKKGLEIGLGISVTIIVLGIIGFIVFWLRTRYIERKKIDDLERTVEWVTKGTKAKDKQAKESKKNTKKHSKGDKNNATSVKKDTTPPKLPAEAALNEEELAIARRFGLIREPAETSARSPRRTAQRRSGIANLKEKSWFDGEMLMTMTTATGGNGSGSTLTPPPPPAAAAFLPSSPSSSSSCNDDPFGDDHETGIALPRSRSSADEEIDMDMEMENVFNGDEAMENIYRHSANIRNFHGFQPTRLSTITDKSGGVGDVIEMVDIGSD